MKLYCNYVFYHSIESYIIYIYFFVSSKNKAVAKTYKDGIVSPLFEKENSLAAACCQRFSKLAGKAPTAARVRRLDGSLKEHLEESWHRHHLDHQY